MNNLLLTKERIKRAERLRLSQLAATKMECLYPTDLRVLKKGKSKLVKKLQQWILNSELNC